MTPQQNAVLFSMTALASFLSGTLPALADAVLIFDRETTGSLRSERRRPDENSDGATTPQATPASKQSVTVQIKGALARVEFRPFGAKPESVPSSVLLYDGIAQKIFTLDSAAKTYYVQAYKEAIDGVPPRSANAEVGATNRATFTGNVELKAARANNSFVSKEMLGADTRQYLVSGNVAMQFNIQQNQGGVARQDGGVVQRERRPRLQDGTNPAQGSFRFTPPSLAVEGEVWSADGVALFTAGRDTPAAAIYRLMLPDNAGPFGTPLTKPLVTRLKNMKSVPGESTISFRMDTNFRRGANTADPAPARAPMTTHLLLKEMKTDASLNEALFAVPSDYKEIEPPASGLRREGAERERGSRGRGRRFGGNQNNEQQ